MIAANEETKKIASDGLDKGRRVDIEDYLVLADAHAEFGDKVQRLMIAMTNFINCVGGQG